MRAFFFFGSVVILVMHLQDCNGQAILPSPTYAEAAPDTFGLSVGGHVTHIKGYKSTQTGLLLALSTTFVPVLVASRETIRTNTDAGPVLIVAVAAGYVGPSLGNFYAGDKNRAWGGIGLRMAGTLLAGAGIGDLCDERDDKPALVYVGLAVFMGSAIWNFATVHNSVDAHNRKLSKKLAVTPMVSPTTGAAGLRMVVDL